MNNGTFAGLSAARLGRLVQGREISSVELATWSLEALETRGRALNAVAEPAPDLALEQARQADREIARGHIRGPLHGVPYGAKDLFATRGIPTRWGSPAYRDQVFDYDATVVERMREAGAVLVAKLAMVELAGAGGYARAAASLDGPCRNPWDPARWAGGSSSGSGAAVGAGLIPCALGSETWGSITVPAAFCGVSGLRPTYGRVPRFGAMALSWTMDKIGPMARSAEDCSLVLAAIAGHDPHDPSSALAPYTPPTPTPSGAPRARLGLLVRSGEDDPPEVAARFAAALDVFRARGYDVFPLELPDLPYAVAARTIIGVESAAAFEDLLRGPRLADFGDAARQGALLGGLVTPGVDYLRALRIRALGGEAATEVFARCDALIAPTVLLEAPPVDSDLDESLARMGGNGAAGNLLGWPSLSIPMGPGAEGLPLALELIGPPYQEARLLALAMAFQQDTTWHEATPPLP